MKFQTKKIHLLLSLCLFAALSLSLTQKSAISQANAAKSKITYSTKGKYTIKKDHGFSIRFFGYQMNKKQFRVLSVGWSIKDNGNSCANNFIVKNQKGKFLWETPDSARFCPVDGNWRIRRVSDFGLPAFSEPFVLPLQPVKVYIRRDRVIVKDQIFGPATVRWPKK